RFSVKRRSLMFGKTMRNGAVLGAGFLFLAAFCIEGEACPPRRGDEKTVKGTLKRFTEAPRGETDGAVLDDGTVIHWPPHLEKRFTAILAKGDRIEVTGWMETNPEGVEQLEVRSVTNLRTGTTRLNDDDRPPKGKGKKAKGKKARREVRESRTVK